MILINSTYSDSDDLAKVIGAQEEKGWRLMDMFASESASGAVLNVLMRKGEEVLRIMSDVDDSYPSVTPIVPSASLFERKIWEMNGVTPEGHPDLLPVIYWRKGDGHPLQKDEYVRYGEVRTPKPKNSLSGTGVFEIPVGPVHAGVIEPGHFRFSAAGEPILGLRVHLGYAHKGTEKLMEGGPSIERRHLAERISGDNAVSHSLAHAHVMEGETEIPGRARFIRVILSELERIYNHLDVLGGICTDTAFTVAAAFGSEAHEKALRLNQEIFGNRMLKGNVIPGGVRRDLTSEDMSRLETAVMKIRFDAMKLDGYMKGSPSEIDRLETTGILKNGTAKKLGTVGVVARASGIASDVRKELPYDAYRGSSLNAIVSDKGDVMSRASVRMGEISESVSLILQCLNNMEEGDIWTEPVMPEGISCGIVESPRGELLHTADIRDGEVWRYSIRDPSFVNWPALEEAVLNNIVPDFPLINKSFGLSYSGNDV